MESLRAEVWQIFRIVRKIFCIMNYFIDYMKVLRSGLRKLRRKKAWLPLKDCHALESQHRAFCIKIDMLGFGAKLLPISNLEPIFMT